MIRDNSDPLRDLPLPPEDAASRALMPNLFVIGASKSGSSSFHAYLKAHPQISMSRVKEPCFFVEQHELEKNWPIMARSPWSHEWPAYLDLWKGCEQAKYRGEGSVYYSQAPHYSDIPVRIAAHCPDARIVYTVREPITRAIGHYWQRFKEFQEPLPIDQAMRANAIYRDTSDYALQLKQYLAHFDRSQIKVVVAEDLRNRRVEVLSEVFDWLGVDDHQLSDSELAERHKSPSTSRKQRFPLVSKVRDSSLWAFAREHLPAAWVDGLRNTATTKFEKGEVDESGAREYLRRYLAPRREEFEEMIGLHIGAWGPVEQTVTSA